MYHVCLCHSGARIDHGHHDTTAKKALIETLSMESAVIKAKELTNEEDTLIIVTADHSHVFNVGGYPYRGNDILGMKYILLYCIQCRYSCKTKFKSERKATQMLANIHWGETIL